MSARHSLSILLIERERTYVGSGQKIIYDWTHGCVLMRTKPQTGRTGCLDNVLIYP